MNMHVKATFPKFAIGQRVKAIETSYGGAYKKGNFYIVSNASADYDNISTELDEKGSTTNGWRASAFVAAPLFAVGDKVEFTDKVPTSFWFGPHTKHKGGTVSAVNHSIGGADYDVDVYDGDYPAFVDADHIRLAPSYTSCAAAEVDNLAAEYGGGKAASNGGFKAGDRVRYNGKKGLGFDKTMMGKTGTVTKDDGGLCVDVDWDGSPVWSYGIYRENLEHVAVAPATATATATATLRIEAGKFYKTRDGRKVGPMAKIDGGSFC